MLALVVSTNLTDVGPALLFFDSCLVLSRRYKVHSFSASSYRIRKRGLQCG